MEENHKTSSDRKEIGVKNIGGEIKNKKKTHVKYKLACKQVKYTIKKAKNKTWTERTEHEHR